MQYLICFNKIYKYIKVFICIYLLLYYHIITLQLYVIYCGPDPNSRGGLMKSGSIVLWFHGPTYN
jgi:hypothetical protein